MLIIHAKVLMIFLKIIFFSNKSHLLLEDLSLEKYISSLRLRLDCQLLKKGASLKLGKKMFSHGVK